VARRTPRARPRPVGLWLPDRAAVRVRRLGRDGTALLRAPRRRADERALQRPARPLRHEAGLHARAGLVRRRAGRLVADPVSWYLIEQGWEVVGSDGEELGKIEETVGDSTHDIFDGLTVGTGLRSKPRYVPAELVGEIVEGRVTLTIDKDRFERLDEYREPPATEQVEPSLIALASPRATRLASARPAVITRQVASPASVPTIFGCSIP